MVEMGAGGDPVVGMPAAEGVTGGDSVVGEHVEGTDTIPPGGESEESPSGPADLSSEENGQSEPEVEEQECYRVRTSAYQKTTRSVWRIGCKQSTADCRPSSEA